MIFHSYVKSSELFLLVTFSSSKSRPSSLYKYIFCSYPSPCLGRSWENLLGRCFLLRLSYILLEPLPIIGGLAISINLLCPNFNMDMGWWGDGLKPIWFHISEDEHPWATLMLTMARGFWPKPCHFISQKFPYWDNINHLLYQLHF